MRISMPKDNGHMMAQAQSKRDRNVIREFWAFARALYPKAAIWQDEGMWVLDTSLLQKNVAKGER